MIAPLAKFIDCSVLRLVYAILPQSLWREANERDVKLEQAVQFLNGPDFIPAESQSAQLYAQAIAEIRSLSGWLLAEGCPAVALVGVSLGAYLAGLTGCGDARLASIVMALPGTRMGLMLSQAEQVVGRRVREVILRRRAACEELDRTPLNLTSARPAISKENILLIEAMHDVMGWSVPNELWQSWGQPDIWRLPQGHISTALTALMPGLPGRILHWLAPRLEAGRKNNA